MQSSNIHPLAHELNTCALIFSSCSLFTVCPNRIVWRHRSPLRVITTRTQEGGPKEHRAKQNCPRETHSVTDLPWLSIIYDPSRVVAQPPPSFICCPMPPLCHPSSLTSISLVPVLHLLPPSTPFRPSGTHPFFPHAQTVSMLSDLFYSITPPLF